MALTLRGERPLAFRGFGAFRFGTFSFAARTSFSFSFATRTSFSFARALVRSFCRAGCLFLRFNENVFFVKHTCKRGRYTRGSGAAFCRGLSSLNKARDSAFVAIARCRSHWPYASPHRTSDTHKKKPRRQNTKCHNIMSSLCFLLVFEFHRCGCLRCMRRNLCMPHGGNDQGDLLCNTADCSIFPSLFRHHRSKSLIPTQKKSPRPKTKLFAGFGGPILSPKILWSVKVKSSMATGIGRGMANFLTLFYFLCPVED